MSLPPRNLLPTFALALFAMLVPTRAESQAVSYTITDLRPAGIESVAYGINGSGQIVGCYRDSFLASRHAFLFSDAKITDLGTLGGNSSEAFGINASGQVVGGSATADGSNYAFLYSDGTMTGLGTLEGGSGSLANGINAWGQIAGRAVVRVEVIPGHFINSGHAFLHRDGVMTDLGTFGGLESNALGINGSGQVVGYAQTPFGQFRAFSYSEGTITNLGTLGGFSSRATAINDAGQIVGESFTEVPLTNHAFLYSDGVMSDLGTLGGRNSSALAINSYGQIVGSSDTFSGGQRAFLYSSGEMIDLNTFVSPGSGWLVLRTARSINDAGQIVGEGLTTAGFLHAFLASPN